MPNRQSFRQILSKRGTALTARNCASCGATLRPGVDACPVCSALDGEAASTGHSNREQILDSTADAGAHRCPNCAASIASADYRCDMCGYDLRTHAMKLTSAAERSPVRAAPMLRRIGPAAVVVAVTGAAIVGLSALLPTMLNAVAPAAQAPQAAPRVILIAPQATVTLAPTEAPATATPPPQIPTPTVQLGPTIPVIQSDAPLLSQTPSASETPLPTAVVKSGLIPATVRSFQDKVVVRPAPVLGEVLAVVLNGAAIGVECSAQGGSVPEQASAEWYKVHLQDGAVGWIHSSIIDAGGAVPACP